MMAPTSSSRAVHGVNKLVLIGTSVLSRHGPFREEDLWNSYPEEPTPYARQKMLLVQAWPIATVRAGFPDAGQSLRAARQLRSRAPRDSGVDGSASRPTRQGCRRSAFGIGQRDARFLVDDCARNRLAAERYDGASSSMGSTGSTSQLATTIGRLTDSRVNSTHS